MIIGHHLDKTNTVFRAIPDHTGQSRTIQSNKRPNRVKQDHMGSSGTVQDPMGPNLAYKTMWDHGGPYGTLCDHTGPY